jgi:hypothetical protein
LPPGYRIKSRPTAANARQPPRARAFVQGTQAFPYQAGLFGHYRNTLGFRQQLIINSQGGAQGDNEICAATLKAACGKLRKIRGH